MNNASRTIGAVVTAMVLFCSALAMGQDWPQWRGPNRDGKATGFAAPATWPKELASKWKITVGQGNSTPALVGDRLYVFARQNADEVILCLNAADGKEIWSDKYPAPAFQGPDARAHSGPRSSPTVAEGKVVTVGVHGVVSCLDAATGKVAWRNDAYKAVPRFHTAVSPLVADGLAVVHLGSESSGAVVAFDLASGNEKWKWTAEGPAYASPVLMNLDGAKCVVTLTAQSAVGLALADGKLLWQAPFAPAGRMAYNAATPIVDGQTVIISGSGRGTKALHVARDGDAYSVKELWANPQAAPQFNTPVLKDGFLYGVTMQGNLFCIDAKTGKTAWTASSGLGQFAALVDAGSALLVLPNNQELIVFKPNGEKYEELARIKVADSATYAHPVLSGKRVFVKDQQSLALLTIE